MGRRKIYQDHNNVVKARYRRQAAQRQLPLMVELVERVRQSNVPSERLALALLEDYKITVSLSRTAPLALVDSKRGRGGSKAVY